MRYLYYILLGILILLLCVLDCIRQESIGSKCDSILLASISSGVSTRASFRECSTQVPGSMLFVSTINLIVEKCKDKEVPDIISNFVFMYSL